MKSRAKKPEPRVFRYSYDRMPPESEERKWRENGIAQATNFVIEQFLSKTKDRLMMPHDRTILTAYVQHCYDCCLTAPDDPEIIGTELQPPPRMPSTPCPAEGRRRLRISCIRFGARPLCGARFR
jgi:hypothetical protein